MLQSISCCKCGTNEILLPDQDFYKAIRICLCIPDDLYYDEIVRCPHCQAEVALLIRLRTWTSYRYEEMEDKANIIPCEPIPEYEEFEPGPTEVEMMAMEDAYVSSISKRLFAFTEHPFRSEDPFHFKN